MRLDLVLRLKALELAVASDNHDNPDYILEKAERYLKWILIK